MILLGFAWFLFTLDAANSPLVYTFALVTGGLWGALFLHLGLSFPTGRLRSRLDRVLVLAGYVVFPLASCRRCCSPTRTSSAAATARRTSC